MTEQLQIHPSVTAERVCEAAQDAMTSLENPGFCIKCGEEADGCEPDARRYRCEACGARAVYGAEELVLMLVA